MFPLKLRPALIAHGVFARGHAVIVGTDIIAAMAGVTILFLWACELMAAVAMAVKAGLDMATATVDLIKIRVSLAPAASNKILLRFAHSHRSVQNAGCVFMTALATLKDIGGITDLVMFHQRAVTGGAINGFMCAHDVNRVASSTVILSRCGCRRSGQKHGEQDNHPVHDNQVPSGKWGLSGRCGRLSID